MDLSTRCPRCGAVFTASLEQLQLRKGYIRCISCAHIFDGYEAVVAGDASSPSREAVNGQAAAPRAAAPAPTPVPAVPTPAPTPAPAPAPSVLRQRPAAIRHEPRAAAIEPGGPRMAEASSAPGTPEPAFTISPAAQSTVRAEPMIRMRRQAGPAGAMDPAAPFYIDRQPPPDEPKIYAEPRPGDDGEPPLPLPSFLDQRYERRRGFARVFWNVLALTAGAVLLAQLAYVYRTQLAIQIPALRPILTEACRPLKCDVAYSRRILLISIMNSSLRAAAQGADAARNTKQMTLQFTLRNNYDKPQEWPTLTLDLVDFSGTVVAKKNLPPASYLPARTLQGPFAAHSEVVATVPVTVAGANINGYQLGKFFP